MGYTFGLLSYFHLVPFPVAVLLALLAVLIYSLIVGWFVVKLVEIYFSLLCLAFSQLIWAVARVWYGVTGGDDGLNGIPVGDWLAPIVNTYYLILVVVALSLILIYIIRQSPFGRSVHAIRDNRTRAAAIGIDTKRYIFTTFIISGLFSGLAGILLIILLHVAFPSYGSWSKSGDFLFVCLLGDVQFSGSSGWGVHLRVPSLHHLQVFRVLVLDSGHGDHLHRALLPRWGGGVHRDEIPRLQEKTGTA